MKIPLKRYWDLLNNYLKPQRFKVVLLAMLLLSGIGLQLLNPQIMRNFIDTAMSGGSIRQLTFTGLLFLSIALVNQLLSVGTTYVSENIGWTATNALREDLVQHCLQLDMSFHSSHTPGEMIQRIDGDVNALANFFSQFIIRVLGNAILLVGVLIVLFREDWRISVALAGYTVVAFTSLSCIRNLAVPHWRTSSQASADLFGFLEERFSGIEDIRSSGATGYVMSRLYKLARNFFQKSRKAALMSAVMLNSMTILFWVGSTAALALGAYLFNMGTLTVGTVYMVFHYTELLQHPLRGVADQIQDLQKASASILRIEELYQTRSKVEDGPGAHLSSGPLLVEFENVSFSYIKGDTILHELSFRLELGKVLGLVGHTGSGKTTIARLLFRLYDPDNGEIYLNDVNIREARLADLRQQIGLVTQGVQLFHASVRDNLTFFDTSISDQQILKILRELGLWQWYQSLPAGLSTELVMDGVNLSAGEAQLLAFARVFLKDPGLVILDEASSRLDPATERNIKRALDRLFENRTGLIIAHRLATVERVDELIVLENGRIQEQGTYQQLTRDPTSYFYNLLQTELKEEVPR